MNKFDLGLPKFEDTLFSTEEQRQEARLEKVMKIPISEIHDFKQHPFHVRMDEDMVKLIDSVKENGVLMPALVRPDKNGGYEMVSGHRRKFALEQNGMTEIDAPSDFLKVLGKELRVSAIVGAILGLVNGLRIYFMYSVLYAGQYENVMGYAVVVSVSLFFSVVLAKLVGGMLPLAAKKVGLDPAIMATPFITTIVDACSLILYFRIAMLVFANQM